MCLGDDGSGIGETCVSPPLSPLPLPEAGILVEQPQDHDNSVVVVVDRDLLRDKNAQLHELQARLLSAPRGAERKSLQKSAALLDHQIKCLKQNFVHTSEVQKAAVALSECISHPHTPADAIASALQRVIEMPLVLESMDDLALCYLISASEGVITAMQRHPEHPGVMRGGCHALCNLFSGLKQLDNGESIAQQLCRIEVGDAIMLGMAQLLDNRDVQFYGCRLLSILAMNMKQAQSKSAADQYEDGTTTLEDTINRACFFTGARVAVARARRIHSEDLEVSQWADCAMRLL